MTVHERPPASTSAERFHTITSEPGGITSGRARRRVRRDVRERDRLEAPHEHRAAVREVVGRRAGRRRADDPVAGLASELLAADRELELDHAPERRARDDDVVDGDGARRRDARARASAARRRRTRPRRRVTSPASSSRSTHRAEESDAAEVHADHRARRCRGSARARAARSRRRRARPRGRHASAASLASTPCFSASSAERGRAPRRAPARPPAVARTPSRSGRALPCVTTAARLTRLPDGVGDPAVDVIGIRFAGSMLEVDEELPVSLRAGQPGVYDSDRHATPRRARLR